MDNRRKQENHPGGGFFASAETVSIGPVESSKVWSSPTFTKILKKGQSSKLKFFFLQTRQGLVPRIGGSIYRSRMFAKIERCGITFEQKIKLAYLWNKPQDTLTCK
ncbi:unnamed protein product, partial [Porites lobata]